MEIVLHRDVAGYAALAGALLESDPERNTIALSVLDASLRAGTPFELLLTVHEGGQVIGAAQRTEGRPLLVPAVPPRCAAAVDRAVSEGALLAPRGPGAAGDALGAPADTRPTAAADVGTSAARVPDAGRPSDPGSGVLPG